METKNFLTLADFKAIDASIEKKKNLHKEDGLYGAEDIKVYVDMYRKSIVKHQGSDFASGRVSPDDIATNASKHYGKTLEITRADTFDEYPTIHLKEAR